MQASKKNKKSIKLELIIVIIKAVVVVVSEFHVDFGCLYLSRHVCERASVRARVSNRIETTTTTTTTTKIVLTCVKQQGNY